MTAEAFHIIYLPLSEALYRVAFYLLKTADDAEDAVQDIYIKLWERRDMLDAVYNPKAYCITLMRNLCLDRLRKEQKTQISELTGVEKDGGAASDEEMEHREQLESTIKAIGRLPSSQREIMQLKVLEGLSYGEIAKRTGRSELTLRVLLSRARRSIKNEL